MILSSRDTRRFMRLLVPFVSYAAVQLGIADFNAFGDRAPEDVLYVCERLWGPDGRRDLVESFVEENPAGFNRTDLNEVSRWRQGVFGTFDVVADGTDVFYLLGGYAFAVRGIGDEADRVDGYPVRRVRAALLPAGTVITYGISFEEPVRIASDAGPEASRLALERARTDRRVVRTARQYDSMAPGFIAAASDAHPSLGKPAPQHAGRLAGLSWDERDKVVFGELTPLIGEAMTPIVRDNLEEVLVSGQPTSSMAEILGRVGRRTLMDLSQRYGAKVRAGAARARVAQAVLDAMPTDAAELLRDSILMGDLEFGRVLDVFEADDPIVASGDDIDAMRTLPALSFPAVAIFRATGSYVAVMPDVVRKALEEADIDALRDRAHKLETAFRCAGLAATFAGVTDASELAADWEGLSILDPMDEIVDALDVRASLQEAPFGVIRAFGVPCIASDRIASSVSEGPGGALRIQPLVRGIQTSQARIERRPVADLVREHDYGEVWDYLRDQEAFRELTRYLDAHVPEGESDLQFADLVLERLCGFCGTSAPDDVTTEALTRIAAMEFGLAATDDDRDLFEGLLRGLIDTVPNWHANGWPATRLQRGR